MINISGALTQAGERPVLSLQSIAGPGKKLEPDRPTGDRLPELPGDDLADRQPLPEGNAFRTRLAEHDQIDDLLARRVGKVCGQVDLVGRA